MRYRGEVMDSGKNLEVGSNIRYIQNNMYKSISTEIDMNSTAIDILMFIALNPNNCTAKDVCLLKNIRPSLASFHIDKLVNDGYLIRGTVDGDRRKVKLCVTDKSMPIINKGIQIRDEIIRSIVNGISDDDFKIFMKCMDQISTNTKKMKKDL